MIPIADQIRCVEREIAMRRNVYARRVAGATMRRDVADREIHAMESVLASLHEVGSLREALKQAKTDTAEAIRLNEILAEDFTARIAALEAELAKHREVQRG